jgi:N-succinyldiaminopimelate aminotransferase
VTDDITKIPDMPSPFVRLRELLEGIPAGGPVINFALGEPQHEPPAFVGEVIAKHIDDFRYYPMISGLEELRKVIANWLAWRFRLPRPIDPDNEVLVLSGSREGLFLAAIAAKYSVSKRTGRPAVLIPNPFYHTYAAGAMAAGCEPVYLPATREIGFLPDLEKLPYELLARTVAFYISSPANPQGVVADKPYLARLVDLARRFGFLIFSDECYSEIYTTSKPSGMLEAGAPDYANVVVFQSLSKRSNLPGLRVGFAAGDRKFLARFRELRNVSAPHVPVPIQRVAIAAYSDEAHVEDSRQRYVRKFELADRIIGDRYGYSRPAGGFFLWLDVSARAGDEEATLRLWRDAGLRVMPGSYFAREHADGSNPGSGYIRIAIVHNEERTAEALRRLVALLG